MQWYILINQEKQGPLNESQAQQLAQQHPEALCWKEGLAQWIPVGRVDELRPSTNDQVPPPLPRQAGNSPTLADEIDYVIYGEDMQFVEIELDPNESAIAEAGAMMYKDPSITMNTIFGDGSKQESTGFMAKLVGASKRLVTGENVFTTVFTHEGQGKAHVAFAAPFPGTIIPVALDQFGNRLICQRDSFLAAAKGVSIDVHMQKKVMTGLFGGEGFIMQKLEGDGMAFIHAGGTLKEIELQAGQVLHVDTGCVVAMTDTVNFDLEKVDGGIKTMLFAGEGMFYAKLEGPGRVWLQSLPFSRLAGRMLQAQDSNRGEGSSLLGNFGDMLDGDGGF